MKFTARDRLKLITGAGALILPACGGGGSASSFSAVTPSVTPAIAPPAPTPAPEPEPTPAPEPVPAVSSAPVEGLLRDTFRNNFEMGVAMTSFQAQEMGLSSRVALSQFNAMTPEFEMQMQVIAPQEGVFNFEQADRIVDFGLENNLPMRGHALLWHEVTPDYMLVGSRDDIRQRLDTYIGTVMEHFKDRVKVWDVVNEVVSVDLFRGDAGVGPDRRANWFEAVGNADYIDWAFIAARAADPDALLFINDFNTEEPRKLGWLIDIIRRLRERGVPIDGVGHQTHMLLETSADDVLASIDAVHNEFLGLITHITEMDVTYYSDPGTCFETGTNCLPDLGPNPPEPLLQQHAQLLRDVFAGFVERPFIESVTMWGVHDGESFLNGNPAERFNHPLIFDRQGDPKPAFLAITDPDYEI